MGRARPDLLVALAPPLGRGYLRLAAATSRYRFAGRERLAAARARGGPILSCFWHNRLLGPVIPHRDERAGVVISQSRDGELVSRLVEGFGYVGLRGSTSRGGSGALRAVLAHLRQGLDIAVTPDGPKGPRYRVQQGIAYLAARTGLPVVPVGVGMSRKAVFSSWDRFQVPLPFGTIQLVYGEPLVFGREDELEGVAEAIRSALSSMTDEADRLLGVTSP